MKYFIRVFLILIPLFFSIFILRYVKNKRQKEEKNTQDKDIEKFSEEGYILKFPTLYQVIPFLLIVMTTVITIIILITQRENWPYIILGWFFLGLPGTLMFIFYSLWKVEIRKEEFVYRNFVGKTRIYKYEELEYRDSEKGLKWYFYKNGKKVFSMAYFVEGGNKLAKVYRKYQTKNRSRERDALKQEL